MCQNDCNDYSNQSANTGITIISSGDPDLTGASAVPVFTAAANGSIIKSINIKAIQATLQGMVRIFISDGAMSPTIALYKEVPIPIVPQAASVPVPTPQYIMYETKLCGELKLKSGYQILASTQNTQTFNVFVEGLDWSYPAHGHLPPTCCNFEQDTANTGIRIADVNQALDGSGTINAILTAGSPNGSFVKAITIKALQNTHEGAVRVFIYDTGATHPVWFLIQEVWIPETTQSAYEPSFKHVIEFNYRLQSGYKIGVTTQNAEGFAITIEAEDWVYPVFP